MTNKHEGDIRGFHHLSEAWYGPANLVDTSFLAEIMIGMYTPEGGTSGEFAIRWTEVVNESVARLEVFEDAWSALSQFQDVLAKMVDLDHTCPTPKDICKLLKSCGVVDMTSRERE